MLDHTQTAESNPATSPSRRPLPIPVNAVLATQLVLVAGSCLLVGFLPYLFSQEETEIVSYTAPREAARNLPAAAKEEPGKPGRLWGAIVPREADVWYFKLTGPIEDVQENEPKLGDFLQTVRFENERPVWTLPETWTQRPGNEIRFATIVVPAKTDPMELTVIKLPRNGPLDKLLLDNVNRWREQISLAALTPEQLSVETKRIMVDGVESTLVSLEGVLKPSSMGRAPFAR